MGLVLDVKSTCTNQQKINGIVYAMLHLASRYLAERDMGLRMHRVPGINGIVFAMLHILG